MDVLHEIQRSNGRSVALLQHERTSIGRERDRYYVRGYNAGNPAECVSVYLTSEEVDRLTAARSNRISEDMGLADSIFRTLRSLRHVQRKR